MGKEIKKLELLAPAQNKECAFAAINYGADSIYIGANLYGARKNAANSLDDIKDIIDYAHKFNVKIYITLNTILDDDELNEAQKIIENLHKIGADGIIFQDMGIIELAMEGKLPDIKLIASTQCNNRSIEKVNFFENIGIKKVILARELSIEQIKNICKNTTCEIETFIHGALCVSYSGQCYLSHKIGGRSANRGECAQACRKKYTLINNNGKILAKDKHLLSMKDFMAANRLRELIDAGVTSFKIEGRLKDENYIKNTVAYYRKLFDKIIDEKNLAKKADEPLYQKSSSGKIFFDFTPDLTKSFNRGFCEYFLDGRKFLDGENIYNFDAPNSKGEYIEKILSVQNAGRQQFFTIDSKAAQNLNPQDGLCYIAKKAGESFLQGFLINSIDKKTGKIYPNIAQNFSAGTKIYRNKDFNFENILKNSKTKRKIRGIFKVYDRYIECIDEDNNKINLEFFANEIAKNPNMAKENWKKALQKSGESNFYIENIEFLTENIYFLPIAKINELRREILDKLMNFRINNYTIETQNKINPAQYLEKEGDYKLNVHNKMAEKFYNACNCKVLEYSPESSANHGNIELMRTKHCIRYALNMCFKKDSKSLSNEELFLIDDMGAKYRLIFDCKNCEMVIKSFK